MNHRVKLQLNIIRDLGYNIPDDANVLDLGCGNGATVSSFRQLGYRGYGCDFKFKEGPEVLLLQDANEIRLISDAPYRLPFDDGMFDLIVSDQVFEHVQDYPQTLAEIKRVLKPGGINLHIFPSRYRFLEPHVKIPYATIVQSYWWLRLWATLGIRNKHQRGLASGDAAQRSFNYLNNKTKYLRKPQIQTLVGTEFSSVQFAERYYLKHSRKGSFSRTLITWLPFLPALYGHFKTRVLAFSN